MSSSGGLPPAMVDDGREKRLRNTRQAMVAIPWIIFVSAAAWGFLKLAPPDAAPPHVAEVASVALSFVGAAGLLGWQEWGRLILVYVSAANLLLLGGVGILIVSQIGAGGMPALIPPLLGAIFPAFFLANLATEAAKSLIRAGGSVEKALEGVS